MTEFLSKDKVITMLVGLVTLLNTALQTIIIFGVTRITDRVDTAITDSILMREWRIHVDEELDEIQSELKELKKR